MSEYNLLEHAEGGSVTESLADFVRANALAVGIVASILVIVIVILIVKYAFKEGLANPTATLKLTKRDDYGTEGMTNDNAADQSLTKASVDATAGDGDLSAASCAAAMADKSTDRPAYDWMNTQLHADSSQESMSSRPKDDNDFSKILLGN